MKVVTSTTIREESMTGLEEEILFRVLQLQNNCVNKRTITGD